MEKVKYHVRINNGRIIRVLTEGEYKIRVYMELMEVRILDIIPFKDNEDDQIDIEIF